MEKLKTQGKNSRSGRIFPRLASQVVLKKKPELIALFYRIDPFSVLPKSFCRKDPSTGVQKMIKCLACESQIEAVDMLKAHLKGQKHQKAFQV